MPSSERPGPAGMSVAPAAPSEPSRALWLRVLPLLLTVVALAVLVQSDAAHQILLRGLTAVEVLIDARPQLGMIVFVAAAALSAILAFFSSAVLVPAAVQAWGAPLSLFLLWGGWTLGGVATYAVGRWLGRPAVRALIGELTLARFDDRISARTPFAVVLLFQFALPSEVPGFVLGLARYSFYRYLLALAVTELPYALGAIGLGKGLLERRTALLLGIGVAMAAITAWALRRLSKRLAA